jgi:hypothetical protein
MVAWDTCLKYEVLTYSEPDIIILVHPFEIGVTHVIRRALTCGYQQAKQCYEANFQVVQDFKQLHMKLYQRYQAKHSTCK